MKLKNMFHYTFENNLNFWKITYENSCNKIFYVYLLFTFNLSSDTAGDSGTGGDTDLAAGTLIDVSSGPSSNGMQQFCLTNMP